MISSILQRKGSDVATIRPDATVEQAIAQLVERRVGALVVSTGDGQISGILSERDIVRTLAHEAGRTLGMQVSELMTAEVITCSPTSTTSELMELMTNRRIRHVPVVQAGKLAGIVSIGDVVSKRLRELEDERQQIEEYITHG